MEQRIWLSRRLGLSRGTYVVCLHFAWTTPWKLWSLMCKLKPNYIHFSMANLNESVTPVIRFWAHSNPLWLHFDFIASTKTLFPDKVTFTGPRVNTSTYLFWERNSTLHRYLVLSCFPFCLKLFYPWDQQWPHFWDPFFLPLHLQAYKLFFLEFVLPLCERLAEKQGMVTPHHFLHHQTDML